MSNFLNNLWRGLSPFHYLELAIACLIMLLIGMNVKELLWCLPVYLVLMIVRIKERGENESV